MNSITNNSKKQSGNLPIFSANGRIIGNVSGETFKKTVQGSKHMLKKPRAWAVDADAVRQAQEAGAKMIEIKDTENNQTYRTSIEFFVRFGLKVNRGFGAQIALPLERWAVNKPGLVCPQQMSLFGGAA